MSHFRDQDPCAHVWPSLLVPDSRCEICGLPYAEWTIEPDFDDDDTLDDGPAPTPYHPFQEFTSVRGLGDHLEIDHDVEVPDRYAVAYARHRALHVEMKEGWA